jgi:hypothetical protein
LRAFQKLARPHPIFLKKTALLEHPAGIGFPKKLFPQDSFHHAQPPGRHSELIVAIVQEGLLLLPLAADFVVIQ